MQGEPCGSAQRARLVDWLSELQGQRCCYCGRRRPLTIDHLVARALEGNPRSWDNLVGACWPCNRQKADASLEDWYQKAGMPADRRARKLLLAALLEVKP